MLKLKPRPIQKDDITPMPIPRSKIDEIRTANSLVTVLNEYGVELKHSGARLTGLCPLHNERSPSFSVNPSTNTYKCFGCGEGGDVIALIMELESLSFVGSLEFLADKAGIVIERDEEEDETFQKRQVIYKLLKETASWYMAQFNALDNTHLAKVELQRRNLLHIPGNPQWLVTNGIGYAPDGWDKLCNYLKSRGYTDEQIVDAGMATKSPDSGRVTDRYRGRLTWEIRDVQGRIVGFGARKLFESDNGPKYLNPPQTLLYDKSRILYGLDGARKAMSQKRELYLVEGYTDVMTLRAVGLDNVVAMSGTAFGEGHISLLRRVFDDVSAAKNSVGKMIFVFDGDAAGQKAAKRVFEMEGLPHERSYGVALSEGDPDDIRQEKGDDYLKKSLSNYIPFTEYALKAEMKNHDLKTPEGRLNYIDKGLDITSVIVSAGLRDEYKRKIAFFAGVPVDSVGNHRPVYQQQDDYYDEQEQWMQQETPAMHHQRVCLALLFQYPAQSMDVIKEQGITVDFFSDPYASPFASLVEKAKSLEVFGDPVIFASDDIADNGLGMELLHFPLALKATDESISEAIKNAYAGIRKFAHQKENSSLNSQLAQLASGIEEGDEDQMEALEALLAARKEAAARKRGKKTDSHNALKTSFVPVVSNPPAEPVVVKEETQPEPKKPDLTREIAPW
jgi:DNA primase catalytic core